MLRYEDLCDILFDSAERAGLEIRRVEHHVETQTMDRYCLFVCVPQGDEPPHRVRAEISFTWDSVLTAQSVYGGNCSLYHAEEDDCTHKEIQPDVFVELEIRYVFDVPSAEQVPQLANTIKQILFEQIDHDNIPEVKFVISVLPDGRVAVHEAYAVYVWEVDCNNEPDVDDMFAEVHRIMTALIRSGYFPKSGEMLL
ncbi:MAG: hypothetical protein LOD90_07210 [Symbiobacteriaceae bacterium]|nr:MAG: hypothetical protein DIU69_06000 [Bacillota bacterium]